MITNIAYISHAFSRDLKGFSCHRYSERMNDNNKNNTNSLKFREPKLKSIKELILDLPKFMKINFQGEYGNHLKIINTELDT